MFKEQNLHIGKFSNDFDVSESESDENESESSNFSMNTDMLSDRINETNRKLIEKSKSNFDVLLNEPDFYEDSNTKMLTQEDRTLDKIDLEAGEVTFKMSGNAISPVAQI